MYEKFSDLRDKASELKLEAGFTGAIHDTVAAKVEERRDRKKMTEEN